MSLTVSRVLASGYAALLVFSIAVGAQAEAIVVAKHDNLLHVRNTTSGDNYSPFFTADTGGNAFLPTPNGWFPLDVTQAANPATAASTTPHKLFSIVGDSTAAGNWTDGNGIPAGITLTFDAEFTISAKQTEPGMMLTVNGAPGTTQSGRGIGLTVIENAIDDIQPPRRLQFSTVTVSNLNFSGTLADSGYTFTPGGVSNFGVQLFESGQFSPAGPDTKGFVLEHSTGTIGFGVTAGSGTTAGTEYSNLRMRTNFGIYADPPVTVDASSHFPRQSFPFEIGASVNEGMFRGFTLGYDVSYDISAAVTEDADFDGDGDIDGADFLTWQRNVGIGTDLSTGDANDDNVVDGDDLAIWEGQFGTTVAAATSVPEPASALLALAAAIGAVASRYGRRVG